MITDHTKGPLRAERGTILTEDNVAIAEVFSGAAASLREAGANALLFAAAPDLFATLDELIAAGEEMRADPGTGNASRYHNAVEQALTAKNRAIYG